MGVAFYAKFRYPINHVVYHPLPRVKATGEPAGKDLTSSFPLI